MNNLTNHPLADLFPLMSDVELQELASDIKARGLLKPVVLHEGKILDGRNRYLACKMAGVEAMTVTFRPELLNQTPEEFVYSRNVVRRHLTPSQRAAMAAEFVV